MLICSFLVILVPMEEYALNDVMFPKDTTGYRHREDVDGCHKLNKWVYGMGGA